MIELNQKGIGSMQPPGALHLEAGAYTMTASGRDIWETQDSGFFAYVAYTGDFTCTVRIESLRMANLYTKAGIMVRETMHAESKNVFFVAFGDNGPRRNNNGGCELQYRDSLGGESFAVYPEKTPGGQTSFPATYPDVWLRLRRSGSVFSAQFSNDGETWLDYGTHTAEFARAALLGVCLTAHDESQQTECRFSAFTIDSD